MKNVYKVCFDLSGGCSLDDGAQIAIAMSQSLGLPLGRVSFTHNEREYQWELKQISGPPIEGVK